MQCILTNFVLLSDAKKMGIIIDHTMRPTHGVPTITVHGKGLHGLEAPSATLYTGNSGTTTRLMSGILAAQAFDSTITGDMSIEKRPMNISKYEIK